MIEALIIIAAGAAAAAAYYRGKWLEAKADAESYHAALADAEARLSDGDASTTGAGGPGGRPR